MIVNNQETVHCFLSSCHPDNGLKKAFAHFNEAILASQVHYPGGKMSKIYVGLAIADGMFPEAVSASRRPLTVEEAKSLIEAGVQSCCNPSHALTLDALREKYGIAVPIPEKPIFVKLSTGDKVIVLSARFPRRLNEGERWTKEEVERAEFKFGLWEVL